MRTIKLMLGDAEYVAEAGTELVRLYEKNSDGAEKREAWFLIAFLHLVSDNLRATQEQAEKIPVWKMPCKNG